MRSNTLLLVATSLAASVYASFENTAPLLVSSSKYDKRACKYIQSVTAATNSILSLTEDICRNQEDNDDLEKLLYLRIHGLDNNDINEEFINYFDVDSKLHMLSNHVVYKENQDNTFDISSCGDALTIDTKNVESDEDWINALLASESNVNIIDFYKSTNLAESLSKLSMVYSAQNFIIQGLPSFESPDSLLDNAALKLKYFLGNQKRHSQEEEIEELDYESIGKELEEAFEEVNSLLEEETVTIYKSADDINDQSVSSSSKKIVGADGSLFDKYGFFSSGIWMGTIVSLFIFWLLSVALSWLSSMQISYRAFDKPVNVEKKMQ